MTRRVADLFSEKLIPNKPVQPVSRDLDIPKQAENLGIGSRILGTLGFNTMMEKKEETAPIAFTYSLFYVYYD